MARLHAYASLFCCLFFCALLTVVVPLSSAQAAGQQIVLRDFVLDNSEGQITIRYGISFTELDALRLMLKEGAQITLSCEASLSRPGTFWFGETMTQQELTSTLSYDALTREYVITLSNKPTLYKAGSLVKLLEETWENLTLGVGQLTNLERGQDYTVDLYIRAKSDSVPPWLEKTLFFWSWDVAPSMHYSMHFTF